jgi:hypothetical protein
MIFTFKLKHGDCEWLSLNRGELNMVHISNMSSDEVTIYLGADAMNPFYETCISPYGSIKINKGDFHQSSIYIKVEGNDNRKYIVGVEY